MSEEEFVDEEERKGMDPGSEEGEAGPDPVLFGRGEEVEEKRNEPLDRRQESTQPAEETRDFRDVDEVDAESAEFWADQKQLWDAWEKEKNELERKIEEQMKQLESLGDASKDVGEMITKEPAQDSSISSEVEDEGMPVLDEDVDEDTPEGWEKDIQDVPRRQTKSISLPSDLMRMLLRCLEFVFAIFILRWAIAMLNDYYFNPLSTRPS